jgi:basic membrane protein A
MLLSGPINDAGWNQSGYEGLLLIKERMGAEIAYSDNIKEADILELTRSYAQQGYKIIFGDGYEYGTAFLTVAEEYPDTYFVQVGGMDSNGANMGSVDAGESGANGWLMGLGAGLMTKSNKIGLLGAVDVPTVVNEFVAAEQAAKTVNPDVEVNTLYTGSWIDVELAREGALAMISSGVDVMVGEGDAVNIGMINAAKESTGVKVICFARDQSALGPDVVAYSVLYQIQLAILGAAQDIQNGQFKGDFKLLTTRDGGLDVTPFSSWVPKEVQTTVLAALEDMKQGKFEFTLPNP